MRFLREGSRCVKQLHFRINCGRATAHHSNEVRYGNEWPGSELFTAHVFSCHFIERAQYTHGLSVRMSRNTTDYISVDRHHALERTPTGRSFSATI